MTDKKSFLLRMSPELYDALAAWSGEELRSMNGQIEFLLRQALADAGRLPRQPPATRLTQAGPGGKT